jgi:hypothetical protein
VHIRNVAKLITLKLIDAFAVLSGIILILFSRYTDNGYRLETRCFLHFDYQLYKGEVLSKSVVTIVTVSYTPEVNE